MDEKNKNLFTLFMIWKIKIMTQDLFTTVGGLKLLLGVTHLHAEYYGEVENYTKSVLQKNL